VEFWNKQAYEIAKKVTGNHELHTDLVAHVFLLLQDKEIPDDDLPKLFARYCWNQWTWKESDFNKIFRCHSFEEARNKANDEEEIISSNQMYKKILYNYLSDISETREDMFIKGVAQMYLKGWTYRKINKKTGLSLGIIHKTMKKLKYDLYNYTDEHRNGKSIADIKSP
jgi:uncharacterized protein YerC